MQKPEIFFEERHPAYEHYKPLWERIYLAYRGGSAFKEAFLWRYEREGQGDFEERLARCSYENHTQHIIQRFDSLVFRRSAKREATAGKRERWAELNEDIDLRGNAREDFVRNCFHLAQIFGWLPVLIDQTPGRAETDQGREEWGIRPFARPILPFSFLNWETNRFGELEWVVIESKGGEPIAPMEEREDITEYRIINRQTTQIWIKETKKDKNKKSITEYNMKEEISHGLGLVPIAILYDKRIPNESVVGISQVADSVDQSVLLFNYMSYSGELAHKTLFNMLAAPESMDTGEESKIVGPAYVFWYPEGAAPPAWVGPPVDSVVTLRKEIQDIRRNIYRLSELDEGHADEKREELSGVAYSIRRVDTEEKARQLAMNLEAFEEQLDFLMMNAWEGDAKFESEIVYPRRFGQRSTREALEQQRIIEESTTLPMQVKQVLAAGIINTTDFAELDEEKQKELEQEILDFNPLATDVEQTRQLEGARAEAAERLEIAKREANQAYGREMAAAQLEAEKLKRETELEKAKMEAKKPQEERPKSKLREFLGQS